MGCTSDVVLTGITYSCEDVPVGGLDKVYIARKDKTTITHDIDETTITDICFEAVDDVVQLEFNNKDGFSNFTDVKTVEAGGNVSTVPTISLEFPKMTKAKRDELDALASAGLELVAFVRTASGTQHCVGWEFGLYGSSVNGQSGTGRAEKNVYQFTLTGEETSLALDVDDTMWALVESPVACT